MKAELPMQIILTAPPAGVDYGLQKGSGNNYQTVQKQRSVGKDLQFNFTITVKSTDADSPDFSGPYVQGPSKERFIYIDIGEAAGQLGSQWRRRLKVPLKDISLKQPGLLSNTSACMLTTIIPGTGKDGGPNCATVKPFPGWQLIMQ